MLVNVNNIRHQARRLLDDVGLPTRQARAVRDTLLLAVLVELEPERKDVQVLLFQAVLCATNTAPRKNHCAVCGIVPSKYWTALATDLYNVGLHCPAHKETFHSVCEATYNCICCEQYDPDCDYEWRAPREPQE